PRGQPQRLPGDSGGGGLSVDVDDVDQPRRRHPLQAGRPAGGAQMSAVLNTPPVGGGPSALPQHSEGVWHAAWRRLKSDRVGMVSLGVVLVFVALILLSASGLVAKNWQKE